MRRPAALASGALVALLAVGGWLVFTPSGGPLRSLSGGGQPVIGAAAGPVQPGQPQLATAFVFNPSRDPATLLSASLVPVTGLRAGKLTHVAVDTNHDYMVAGKNWPPGVPIEPLPGARLGHGQTGVVFGMTGNKHGFFYAAGLKLTYRWHGDTYTVTVWSVSVACVQVHDPACNNAMLAAQNRTDKMAGVG
jgi:hypothetical protein